MEIICTRGNNNTNIVYITIRQMQIKMTIDWQYLTLILTLMIIIPKEKHKMRCWGFKKKEL